MKFPWVSLTFLVTPRLMVCLRLHAVSTPLVVFDTIESGLSGASYREGSAGLKRFKVELAPGGQGRRSPTHTGG